ncbi:CBM35 domain-containing protein [Streptomyces sp. SP18CS02]|uniref:CBM35 domain-containing protein n=1 Tax=Streptomyces sp. SP18CS02 TaxID=3002531 RepID=UPI002E76D754|nr:CBM35 domain-containing protein [Streptomyces sp. SP18CS02]MEE1755646.1 CBM35 domain-containing protein [Streptomyces sp. SP18CS02]
MAAGNNGAGTPEDDDPFGYLYEDGQAAGAQAPRQGGGYGYPGPASQPGVPRTSYNQVRAVGERQYGQVPPQHQYGQQQTQQAYGRPAAQYAAPETYPGGAPTRQSPLPGQQPQRGGRSGGPNTKGLLIGAIAVVAVVVVGITVALLTKGGESDDGKGNEAVQPPSSSSSPQEPSSKPSDDGEKPAELPKQDAATLQLGPPAALATDVKGAEGTNGAYVTNFNAVGAGVTWKADVAEAGEYKLYVRYAIPAQDANATLTINGKANSNPIGLKNFIHSTDPNWEKNWQTTWAPVTLKQGENEVKISCEQGNQCNAILDWLEVRPA